MKFANFTVKDVEGAKLLGVERGVPASPKIREAVSADLDAMGKLVVDFISHVTPKVGPIPPAPPQGRRRDPDACCAALRSRSASAAYPWPTAASNTSAKPRPS